MTKKDLINTIRRANNQSQKNSEDLVDTILDIIKDTLASGKEVKISGFGKFIVRRKKDRTGRNPQTGEVMTITARNVVSFKPSTLLKRNSYQD